MCRNEAEMREVLQTWSSFCDLRGRGLALQKRWWIRLCRPCCIEVAAGPASSALARPLFWLKKMEVALYVRTCRSTHFTCTEWHAIRMPWGEVPTALYVLAVYNYFWRPKVESNTHVHLARDIWTLNFDDGRTTQIGSAMPLCWLNIYVSTGMQYWYGLLGNDCSDAVWEWRCGQTDRQTDTIISTPTEESAWDVCTL